MKYLLVFLVLVFSDYSASQTKIPDLVIPITVTFDIPPYPPPYPGVEYLEIGLDSTATDSLDEHLGEYDLPLIPPPGWPAYFKLPVGNIKVHKDFRFGELPYTGTKIHRLQFCSECGATIHWVLPEGATGQLKDLLGGIFVNVPMIGSGSYYVSNFNINDLRMTINYVNVVPVELVSFTAKVIDSKVELNWTTATETNNRGFEIERQTGSEQSAQGKWETIGFVPGSGTTTEPKSYSFTDNLSHTLTHTLNLTLALKYRLKQIDYDGSYKYSNEAEVTVDFTPKEFVLYQNYPNPFNPVTTISWQSPVGSHQTLKIFDVLGSEIATLVDEFREAGRYEIEFDAKNLSSGIYYYKLNAGEYFQTKKMMLMK